LRRGFPRLLRFFPRFFPAFTTTDFTHWFASNVVHPDGSHE